jgi:hypothetical protein
MKSASPGKKSSIEKSTSKVDRKNNKGEREIAAM